MAIDKAFAPLIRRMVAALKTRKAQLLCLLIVGSGLAAILPKESAIDQSRPTKTSDRYSGGEASVSVTLGQTALQIPKSYLSGAPATERGATQLILWALLPDFSPPTFENRQQFAESGWGRAIQILVSYKAHKRSMKETFDFMLTDGGQTKHKQIGQSDNLGKFLWLGREVLFSGTVEAPGFIVICSPSQWIGGIPPAKSPSCSERTHLGEDLYADWDFSREFLSQTVDIERALVAKLNEFRTSGPVLEVLP